MSRNSLHRIHLAGLMLGLAVLLAASLGRADLPNPDRVADDALVVIGIENTEDFWSKVEALPVTAATRQWFAGPAMAQDLDFQAFQLELDKLSSSLGFEASVRELMTNVLENAQLVVGGSVDAKEPDVRVRLGIDDQDKAQKLIDVVSARLQEKIAKAADAATTGTKSPGEFEELDVAGQKTFRFTSADGDQAFFGIVGDSILLSNSQASYQALAEDTAPSAKLVDREDYKKTTDAVDWDDADFSMFIDADALAGSAGMSAMQLPGLQKAGQAAVAAKLLPTAIEAEAATTYNQLAGSPQLQVGKLKGTYAASAQPLIAVVYGIFDGKKTLEQFREMMSAPQMGGIDVNAALQSFEQNTQISVEQELIPALGQDLVFALNGMQPNPTMPFLPSLDLVIGAEVADAAKMQAVTTKLETLLQQAISGLSMMMQGGMGGEMQTPPTAQVQTLNVEGADVRMINSGIPGLAPSHTMVDGYWLMSLTLEGLTGALKRRSSGQDVTSSPIYAELAEKAGDEPRLSYSVVNLRQILQAVVPMVSPFLGNQNDPNSVKALSFVNEVLTHIGPMASTDVLVDDLNKSYIKVQFE